MELTPEELEAVLLEIDNKLKDENLPPHARPLHAIMHFGKRFGVKMPIAGVPTAPGVPADLKENQKYTDAIHDWYDRVYGEKIKLDPSEKRRVAVRAHGDIWEMRLPLVYGTISPVFSYDLEQDEPRLSKDRPIEFNMLSSLTGLTADRAKLFADNDFSEIKTIFFTGMDVCYMLNDLKKQSPRCDESLSDLATAVFHLCTQQPNYGQSKWASLQFVEKSLKGIIEIGGYGNPKQRHNIAALWNELTEPLRLENEIRRIDAVACSAATRYGELNTSKDEAYDSHAAGLKLVRSALLAHFAAIK